MPNKLSLFWQELKRRKVTRVITVYAAASFVILQLVEILAPSLRLPEWTMNVVLVLLIVGFIIAVILSWIYDIHPEGGIVKTEPATKVSEKVTPSSNSWKIASYISFVVIVGLIVLNIIPRTNNNRKVLEKSIAVLPLDYLSEEPKNEYLANGVLDAITGHLSMIEGLRVMPRTSVEQYRENKKSAREIGEELDVSYLIEGSFLMVGDEVILTIQLVIAGEGDHVFFKEYHRDYKDILEVHSEVAKTIAGEIEVAITPEELRRIENKPTSNLTAYDFYIKGEELLYDWWENRDTTALIDSEILFNKALEYDSTYALAYARLAWIQYTKEPEADHLEDDYLDSALILADIALSYDSQLAEAYDVKGNTLFLKGKIDLAIEELGKAIEYKPNFFESYWDLGAIYLSIGKYDLAIKNLYRASTLHRGNFLPHIFRGIAFAYLNSGFDEKFQSYISKTFELDRDTIKYLTNLAIYEDANGNYNERIKYLKDAYALDSSSLHRLSILWGIAYSNSFLGHFEESLMHFKKWETELEVHGISNVNNLHRIGYVHWKLGDKEKANFYFREQIKTHLRLNEMGSTMSSIGYTYYDLAGIYAFLGEKDRAYENLRIFKQIQSMPKWLYTLIQNDYLFDNIRNEPEFQQILTDIEVKYQASQERVRQWLEENDML